MDILIHGKGPQKIIAVHGIQGTNRVWLPLASALAETCTFILPNLPGRGNHRDNSEQDFTLPAFARYIAAAVDAHVAAGEPYCLAGWSMGVSVALELVCNDHLRGKQPDRLALLSGVPDIGQTRWFTAPGGPPLLAEIAAREKKLALQAAADHQAVMWTWQAIRQASYIKQCGGINQPSLIMTGKLDEDSPLPLVSAFTQLLPDTRFVGIDAAGHNILTEHTGIVAAAFAQFLNLE